MKLYTFDKKKNKRVFCGNYDEKESTFVRKVSRKHFMIIERGYGIQEEVLQELNRLQCQSIIMITKTGRIVSALTDWLQRPTKDYGHGPQRFLGGKK
jgi:hypothetical protein